MKSPSVMRRQVLARMRFGIIFIRLGFRERGMQPRSVVRGCRMVDANIREL